MWKQTKLGLLKEKLLRERERKREREREKHLFNKIKILYQTNL